MKDILEVFLVEQLQTETSTLFGYALMDQSDKWQDLYLSKITTMFQQIGKGFDKLGTIRAVLKTLQNTSFWDCVDLDECPSFTWIVLVHESQTTQGHVQLTEIVTSGRRLTQLQLEKSVSDDDRGVDGLINLLSRSNCLYTLTTKVDTNNWKYFRDVQSFRFDNGAIETIQKNSYSILTSKFFHSCDFKSSYQRYAVRQQFFADRNQTKPNVNYSIDCYYSTWMGEYEIKYQYR